MRGLVIVPVIHTEADMGSLADGLAEVYRNRYGAEKWDEHLRVIHEMWHGIEERIYQFNLDFARVKLYQDGLPVCGKEEAIVRSLAEQGSVNHRLLVCLMERGAQLMGTEDATLLLQEYQLAKEQLERQTGSAPFGEEFQQAGILRPGGRRRPEGAAVNQPGLLGRRKEVKRNPQDAKGSLERRDRFIAGRIHDTLARGETGILFIGLMHRVHRHVPSDVGVKFLIHRLPFGRNVK